MSNKINWLVKHSLPGSLVVQPWLTENEIRYSLAQKYVASGWLKRLGPGLYMRPTSDKSLTPNWADALYAVAEQLHLPVHLAGLSSLSQQGLSHYLSVGQENVWVGVKHKARLPKWFREWPNQTWQYCGNHKLLDYLPDDFITLSVNGKTLKASAAELAAYEVADNVGKYISFQHAADLFQGLINLRPGRVQSLLNRSNAVQTNRIFLFLSHYYDHQWVKRLDESTIMLGKGNRQVVKNGHLDPRYQITIPESFAKHAQAEYG